MKLVINRKTKEVYKSIVEAAQKLGLPKATLYRIATGKGEPIECDVRYVGEEDLVFNPCKYGVIGAPKKKIRNTITGVVYNSITEAAEGEGMAISTITHRLTGRTKKGGFEYCK